MSTKAITRIALATATVLLVPFVAMQFTDEVNWDLGDFVVAGALLIGVGLSYALLARKRTSTIYRAAIGATVAAVLFLAWISLAVGFP